MHIFHIKVPFSIFLILIVFFSSCEDPVYTPRPRGYPKVTYPEKAYQQFDADYCHFQFDYPTYAQVQQDTTFFDERPADPCWFDIYIPAFDSRIYFSYYPIDENNSLQKLKGDAFNLAGKHNVKANYIDEIPVQKPNGVEGFVFDIKGPVASPFQFYLTDSKNHFLRGALYFNTQAKPDSLAPIYDFVKMDIMKMIETFEWEKEEKI